MDRTTSDILDEMLNELNDELTNIDEQLDQEDGPANELYEERDIIEAKQATLLDLGARVEEAYKN